MALRAYLEAERKLRDESTVWLEFNLSLWKEYFHNAFCAKNVSGANIAISAMGIIGDELKRRKQQEAGT